MARYNAEQQQQPSPSVTISGRTASTKTKGSTSKKLDASPARSISSTSVATADRPSSVSGTSKTVRKISAPASASPCRRNRNTKFLYGNRLAPFIAPHQALHGEATNVTSIFALLQDKSSVKNGRQLIHLENEAKRCNEELSDLMRQRANLEAGLASEEKIIASKENAVTIWPALSLRMTHLRKTPCWSD